MEKNWNRIGLTIKYWSSSNNQCQTGTSTILNATNDFPQVHDAAGEVHDASSDDEHIIIYSRYLTDLLKEKKWCVDCYGMLML